MRTGNSSHDLSFISWYYKYCDTEVVPHSSESSEPYHFCSAKIFILKSFLKFSEKTGKMKRFTFISFMVLIETMLPKSFKMAQLPYIPSFKVQISTSTTFSFKYHSAFLFFMRIFTDGFASNMLSELVLKTVPAAAHDLTRNTFIYTQKIKFLEGRHVKLSRLAEKLQ